jgi:hypothetical protein
MNDFACIPSVFPFSFGSARKFSFQDFRDVIDALDFIRDHKERACSRRASYNLLIAFEGHPTYGCEKCNQSGKNNANEEDDNMLNYHPSKSRSTTNVTLFIHPNTLDLK